MTESTLVSVFCFSIIASSNKQVFLNEHGLFWPWNLSDIKGDSHCNVDKKTELFINTVVKLSNIKSTV